MTTISFREDPHTFQYTTGNRSRNPPLNILIHGYHNTDQDALDSYNNIEKNLDRQCLGLFWPGEKLFIKFPTALRNAVFTGWRFNDYLHSLDPLILQQMTIQTHSAGALVACEALNGDIKVGHLILSAPAIPEDSFKKRYFNVLSNVKRIDIAFSANDSVLANDYPLGVFDPLQIFSGKAMGRYGSSVMADNLFNHDFSTLVTSHGGYKNCAQYYDTCFRVDF